MQITWEEPAVRNYCELITQFWKEIKENLNDLHVNLYNQYLIFNGCLEVTFFFRMAFFSLKLFQLAFWWILVYFRYLLIQTAMQRHFSSLLCPAVLLKQIINN